MGRKPKPKAKIQNQLVELSKENRRLREIVAYLSEVVLESQRQLKHPQEEWVAPKSNKGPDEQRR
jgi:hypothetical protein